MPAESQIQEFFHSSVKFDHKISISAKPFWLNLSDSGLNSQLCHFGQPPVKVVLAGGLPEAARNHPKIAISAVPTSYLHTLLSRSTEREHKASLITNLYQSH